MGKSGVLLLCCVMFLHTAHLAESIQITSSPEIITYGRRFTLTCHIGILTEEIKWKFRGETYFSCSPPYSAGICFKNASVSYNYFTYDVNITAGISTLTGYTYNNRHEGLWTCSHGGQQATYNFNPGDPAGISSFTTNTTGVVSVGTTVQLTCSLSTTNTLPVDVSISSNGRDGNLTYVTNSTSRTFTVTTTAQCEDSRFTCSAFNAYSYSYVATRQLNLNVECPVQIVYAKTNTTVTATIGLTINLNLYYTGYPRPSFSWYRQISQQSVVKLNSYRTGWGNIVDIPGGYIYLYITNVHIQDGGQYQVHINGSQIIHVFTVDVQSTQVETNDTCTPTDLDSHVFSPVAGIGVGIAVGVVACILIFVVIFVIRRLRTKQPGSSKSDPSPEIVSPEPQSHERTAKGYDNMVLQNNETDEELYEDLDKDLPNTRT